MAGYSGKPLAKKPGIQTGTRVVILGAPPEFGPELCEAPDAVTFQTALEGTSDVDLVLAFVKELSSLLQVFADSIPKTTMAGSIWISWPKKSSGVPSELDENIIRNVGLDAGLVDVKVCAVNEVWSGLKFVRRLQDRV